MPNHVYNTLTVQGSTNEIERFKNQAAAFALDYHDEHDVPVLSFWNFVRPSQYSIDSGRYHAAHGWKDGKESGNTPDNWYNWNRANWGTKWDAYNVELEIHSLSNLQYRFTTAWNAPASVIAAMTEQFPSLRLTLTYKEEGEAFSGTLVGDQGILVDVS
jgi:hypothetical protein